MGEAGRGGLGALHPPDVRRGAARSPTPRRRPRPPCGGRGRCSSWAGRRWRRSRRCGRRLRRSPSPTRCCAPTRSCCAARATASTWPAPTTTATTTPSPSCCSAGAAAGTCRPSSASASRATPTLKVGDLDYAYAPPFEVRRYWLSWNGDATGRAEFMRRNFFNDVSVPNGHALGQYTKDLIPPGKTMFNVPIAEDRTAEHVASQVAAAVRRGQGRDARRWRTASTSPTRRRTSSSSRSSTTNTS